ncbi:MAG: lipocalin-like domain-containing protein [Chloroflexota bacterium]
MPRCYLFRRASPYDTFIGYAGTYEAGVETATHHVAVSSFPNWKGIDFERTIGLEGNRLSLTAPPCRPPAVCKPGILSGSESSRHLPLNCPSNDTKGA